MSDAYLRFWGVRGSHAAPHRSHLDVGGNTSCVELRADGHVLVCDGGTGIISLGDSLLANGDIRELLILFTHYHWDHICGMPFFTPAFLSDWRLRIFGPGENAADIEQRLSAQMKAPYFPVETETWFADIRYLEPRRDGITYGPFQISYRNVHHPGVTYGYRITVRGKSIAYVSDNEFLFLGKSIDQRHTEFSAEEHRLLRQIEHEERIIELDAIRDADILIHDAQYSPHDYQRKRGWGHSCYVDTIHCAIDAGVKTLYLFHHDPSYDDDTVREIYRHCLDIIRDRGASLRCHIAVEGLVVDLD